MGDKRHDTGDHRLASLAAWRGVAILLVIVGHLAPSALTRLVGTPALSLMAYGGVILFFVLSGFLMDRTLAADRSLIAYIIRRAARILPLYWISLVIAFAVAGTWSLRDLALNAGFLVPLAKSELMSGVYWTLYIEVLFYALAPLLVYAGDRAIVLSLYAAIAADVAVFFARGVPSHALYHLTFCLLGMQFGAWYRGKLTDIGLALAVVAVTAHATLSPLGVFVALAPLLSGLLMWFGLRRAINIPLLSFFGAVSYGWYLLHAVVGLPLLAALMLRGWSDWQGAAAAALVSLLLSWGAHVAIERPGIAFGRRVQVATRGLFPSPTDVGPARHPH